MNNNLEVHFIYQVFVDIMLHCGRRTMRIYTFLKIATLKFVGMEKGSTCTGADKSHCPTPWASAFIGRAGALIVHINFITNK